MLVGDFNVVNIDPTQALADNLLSTMDDHDLVNLQHKATRYDNVLDLFCTKKPRLI